MKKFFQYLTISAFGAAAVLFIGAATSGRISSLFNIGHHKVIYVAWRGDNMTGTGIQSDPLNGNTATKFDAIMRQYSSGTHIILLRNPDHVFETYGDQDYTPNKGFRLGINAHVDLGGSTVKPIGLDDRPPGFGKYQVEVFGNLSESDQSGTIVENGTVDCNADALQAQAGTPLQLKTQAVRLEGDNIIIRKIHAIHAYGHNGLECFPIGIGAWGAHISHNGLIEDCILDQPATGSDYGTGISMYSDGGVVRRNLVKDWGGTAAFGALTTRTTFENNIGIDVRQFIYLELNNGTLNTRDIVIRNNFASFGSGMPLLSPPGVGSSFLFIYGGALAGLHLDNIVVDGNYATIRPSSNANIDAFFVVCCNDLGAVNNITISNNTLVKDSRTDPSVNVWTSYSMNNINGVRIFGNHFDPHGIANAGDLSTNVSITEEQSPVSSVQGSLRVASARSTTSDDVTWSIANSNYTIVAGDHLVYDIMCDAQNPTCSFMTEFEPGQIGVNVLYDQNRILHYGNMGNHARDKWYHRDFDLTPIVGSVVGAFRFSITAPDGSGINNPVGSYIFYLNNIRIVSPNGTIKLTYLSPEVVLNNPTILSTSGSPSVYSAIPRWRKLQRYTVATLPASAPIGTELMVTDATSPTYLGNLTGGGAVSAPVVYNGTAWVSH